MTTHRDHWLAYVDRWHGDTDYLRKSGLRGVCECPDGQVGGTCPTSTRYADAKFREELVGLVFHPARNENQ